MRRVGSGCLFWIAVSVILSVTLTVLLNLGLFAFGGYAHQRNGLGEEGADDMLGTGQLAQVLRGRTHQFPAGRVDRRPAVDTERTENWPRRSTFVPSPYWRPSKSGCGDREE